MLYYEGHGITNTAKAIITVTTILGVLAILAVALRVYARIYSKLYLGIDDWTIILALILSCGISIIIDYTDAVTGIGDPDYEPTMEAIIFALKINFACENTQIATMGVIKVSLLFFYRRIFGISRPFVMASNVLIALISSFTLAIVLAVIFSKWPVYLQWDPTAPYDINASAILICYVAGNSFFDLLTLVLPIAAVQRLQMDQSKKLFMSVIFVLGSTCMVASLIRLYYAVQWTKETATISSMFEAPFIYNILWALLEPPIFIVVGSMLTFGPLLRNWRGPKQWIRLISSKKEGSTKSHEARNRPQSHFGSGNSHRNGAEKTLPPISSSQVELLPV
ncbi:hypothetical protein AnigIFM63604_002044 [Aspergillus niger]|uniref:Rhodopsin domain-containing protein n=1 Tax=Aspergillus niger TaxID=5061 RepID=A0A9W6ADN0_ASPNG|nr:hypothetical protein CBS133816_10238 [Aspergillus niger]KAI2841420.1 hypothetical protein CBS12448_10447 [Aspergillus niger]KAI2959207.1 hypothetical protein CBS147324_10349 [Aspergillus niger]KAI2986826.1 hypothetical protein CBS147482_9507 [Aspergillus niger]GLA55396.1 hypothetical protein AnigIFM63604_002044 [Aspergillus niger]